MESFGFSVSRVLLIILMVVKIIGIFFGFLGPELESVVIMFVFAIVYLVFLISVMADQKWGYCFGIAVLLGDLVAVFLIWGSGGIFAVIADVIGICLAGRKIFMD